MTGRTCEDATDGFGRLIWAALLLNLACSESSGAFGFRWAEDAVDNGVGVVSDVDEDEDKDEEAEEEEETEEVEAEAEALSALGAGDGGCVKKKFVEALHVRPRPFGSGFDMGTVSEEKTGKPLARWSVIAGLTTGSGLVMTFTVNG
jgi:hypothetical protein